MHTILGLLFDLVTFFDLKLKHFIIALIMIFLCMAIIKYEEKDIPMKKQESEQVQTSYHKKL